MKKRTIWDQLIDRRRFVGLAAALPFAAAVDFRFSTRCATAASEHKLLPIGMNLNGLADWEPGYPFLNLMWGARVWLTKNADGDGPYSTDLVDKLTLDSDGYPIELPFYADGASGAQIVFTLLPNTLKPGRYVVLYDGEGIIGSDGGSKTVKAQPGRIELVMKHAGADAIEVLTIRKSIRGNHVRNIRVLPIEHEHADLLANPFREDFLQFCRPWHCLRFMDWLGANNSTDRKWEDRKRRSYYTQIGAQGDVLGLFGKPQPRSQLRWSSGVALDVCLQLANLTQKDAWVCVPHLADDNYIIEMARLVRAQLDPRLKVYVEFSNEIWNWQFLQANWMLRSELAGALVDAGGGLPPWKGGKIPSQFVAGVVVSGAGEGKDHPERIGALFRRCFKIWESEFAGADRDRLVRVCPVQIGWADTADRTLKWVMEHGGCDAIAPSGYFGPDEDVYRGWNVKAETLTADDVIADMGPIVEAGAVAARQMGGLARRAGVRLVVYEGGQHIQPQGQAIRPYAAALGAAQTHPGMYDLYRRLLDVYADLDCSLFCAFSSVSAQGTRFGSWGHISHYGQPASEAPKYRAILDANAQ